MSRCRTGLVRWSRGEALEQAGRTPPNLFAHCLSSLRPTGLFESAESSDQVPGVEHLQERLGHATINVTLDTYSQVTAGMQRDAAEAIAAIVNGPV